MAKKEKEVRYTELDEITIGEFMDIVGKKEFGSPLGFTFINDSKQKHAVSVQKLQEKYAFLIGKDILVTFNGDLYDKLDDESKSILMEQELDRVVVNIDTGAINMRKPDVITTSGMINKFGAEAVFRANAIDLLSAAQKEDHEKDFV